MVNDQQVKRLWQLAGRLSLEVAAAKSGMDPKTARKYLRDRRLPSEMRQKHTWRTRRIRLRIAGRRFGHCWLPSQVYKPRRYLNICRGRILGGSAMGK